MTCVCVKAPIAACCGKSYEVGDVADLQPQIAEGLKLQGMVAEAVIFETITCEGIICGRVCNPDWKIKVELDVGDTGEVDYEVELTPNAAGEFGGDIRDIPGTPPAPDPDADPDAPAPVGEKAPLEIDGEQRTLTLSVEVGGDCGVIAKSVSCTVGGELDPCAAANKRGSC